MPSWLIPALVSGAVSTVGSALTRRDNRREVARVDAANKNEAARIQKENQKSVDAAQVKNNEIRQNYYKNVVSDALSAGINPLTALRTGGGQGYATAVAGTMNNAVMLEGVYRKPLLSRNPLSAGLEAGLNTGLNQFNRQKQYSHEARMDELNKSLIKAQVKSMNAEITRGNYDDENSELKFAGKDIQKDEKFTDVEEYEKRYGDLVSALVGAGIAIADARKTAMVILSNEKTANFSRNRRKISKKVLPSLPKTTVKGPQKRGEMRGAY